jgi:hypothetical protein
MAAATENVRALEERLPAPLLGRIAYMGVPDASSLAAQIDIEPLMRFARVRSNARD